MKYIIILLLSISSVSMFGQIAELPKGNIVQNALKEYFENHCITITQVDAIKLSRLTELVERLMKHDQLQENLYIKVSDVFEILNSTDFEVSIRPVKISQSSTVESAQIYIPRNIVGDQLFYHQKRD